MQKELIRAGDTEDEDATVMISDWIQRKYLVYGGGMCGNVGFTW